MNTTQQLWTSTVAQVRGWSWLKRTYAAIFGLGFVISSFLFLTPTGEDIRVWMAQTVITTQHREWAWMFVGHDKRDRMVAQLHLDRERWGSERQNFGMIKVDHKPKRTAADLIKVEDISGSMWKGKKMYVYDPRSIRVVVPGKTGEGERISSMVERTGAIAGINGGGFVDPDGLGNGFAPIGFIISGGKILYTDQDGSIPQHVVGFTKDGVLVVGKYTIVQLQEMGVTEAVMFYPRIIANGKGLITSGDGGWGKGPRTAIGQKEDGTVVIMVIDGRQTHSVGATLKEIQDLMLEDGVVNAGFLDGGASSELVTQEDGLITKPSSRYGERRLPSALLVFADPEEYIPNNPWDGVTEIDPGGAYDHPDFLKEQEELRKKGQLVKPTPKVSVSPTTQSSISPSGKPTGSPGTTGTHSGGGSTAASTAPGNSGSEAPGSSSPAKGTGTETSGHNGASATTNPTPPANTPANPESTVKTNAVTSQPGDGKLATPPPVEPVKSNAELQLEAERKQNLHTPVPGDAATATATPKP